MLKLVLIQIFHYSPSAKDGNFALLAKGTYMSNCLTQACFVQKLGSTSLVTASTDGYFTLWNLTLTLEPFYEQTPSATLSLKQPISISEPASPAIISCESRYQIHSNSIKSLELAHLSETTSLLIAGSDDNALTLSLLDTTSCPDSDSHVEGSTHVQVHTVSIPDAHAASVTTVKIVEQSGSQLTVASSGNDYRVKIWTVDVDTTKSETNAISVRNVVDYYSPVADISSLDVIHKADSELKLIICGVGMELVLAR